MTRLVSDSEQGQLQGAGTSMNSVAGLLAPGLFTVTFAHFIGRTSDHPDVPGSAFLLAALVLLAAMAAAWFATRPRLSADRLV
jgi:DHA1 family tetracycline resistance protein-like MFS transporter